MYRLGKKTAEGFLAFPLLGQCQPMCSWGFLDNFYRSQGCLKNIPTKVFSIACRENNSALECLIFVVKETALSHHPGVTLTTRAETEAPSQLHPLHSQSDQVSSSARLQIFCSSHTNIQILKTFKRGAVTKQQVGWCLQGECKIKEPLGFYPLTVSGWEHPGVLSSCHIPVPHLAVPQVPVPSVHSLLPWGPAPLLNLQLVPQAICTKCIPQHLQCPVLNYQYNTL